MSAPDSVSKLRAGAALEVVIGRLLLQALSPFSIEQLLQFFGALCLSGRSAPRDAGELFVKETEHQAGANGGERGIVARTFITQKRVRGVEFVPFEFSLGFIKPLGNFEPPLQRNMGILPPPDKHHRRPALPQPFQGVVVTAGAKGTGVNVGRIEGGHCAHARMKAGPNREMSTQTDTVAPNPPRAAFLSGKEGHHEIGVPIGTDSSGLVYFNSFPRSEPA